jgi:hypothetical protein
VSIATVVLCPPLPGTRFGYDPAELADALLDDARARTLRIVSPFVPDTETGDDERTARAHWVAHLAIGLATSGAVAPVLLVLGGSSGGLTAALGFSQRAARRAVGGYVLIDAAVPPAESRGGDWPDAPVHYVASPDADPLEVNQARLRGWDVHPIADLAPSSIAAALVPLALN